MNKHVKIVVLMLVLGVIGLGAAKYLLPVWQDYSQKSSSDARATKGTIMLAMDNWVGYQPLCSQQMKTRLRQAGYILECVNDDANYPERMEKLRKGGYQMAVATVDSYLLNGAKEKFPGVIAAVIDESFGGDAMLAWKKTYQNLDQLKTARDLKIALTPDSPSEHLAKAAAVHFDIPALKGDKRPWLVATAGSEEAFQKLVKKEVDIAVLWEPDVSRALKEGKGEIVKLLGTEVTAKLIVDILLVNRDYAQANPEAVKALLSNYFNTLKYYRDNPDELRQDLKKQTELSGEQVEDMLKGVKWASLTDNAQSWFGVSSFGSTPEEGLIETIEGAIRILVGSGDMSASPLPDHNPYRITNSQFVADLYQGLMSAGQFTTPGKVPGSSSAPLAQFKPLADRDWQALREVGTLQVRPILFQTGTASLSYEGKLELDAAAQSLGHYPGFRVLIKGHTSDQGDRNANQKLSIARAEAVQRYLTLTHGLDKNRLRADGYGGTQPLPRQPGESSRAYNYRLPRVELVLVAEVI
jgi:outer membrane protein OmpA-like peptidoglycan-associated protein/ABC-type nitrate/sulfonate/bicarbonate transport system substrate-binding protein